MTGTSLHSDALAERMGLKLLPGVVRERASVTGFVNLTKPKVTAPASHKWRNKKLIINQQPVLLVHCR